VVAGCTGTTAVSFDPKSTDLRVSCVKPVGPNTLRILPGSNSGQYSSLRYESDVAGLEGYVNPGEQITAPGLCQGQLVSVTLYRQIGINSLPLTVNGGSCVGAILAAGTGPHMAFGFTKLTCNLVMNGNQTLSVQ
jgi:hypothetical protein